MKVRLGQLWKVPLFCMASGFLTFYAYAFLVSRFAVEKLPDGSYAANDTLTFLFSAIFFVFTLITGHFFLRNMTVQERFLSAAIQVILLLLALFMQLNTMLTVYATEWSRVINRAVFAVSKDTYTGAFLNCFAPFALSPTKKRK